MLNGLDNREGIVAIGPGKNNISSPLYKSSLQGTLDFLNKPDNIKLLNNNEFDELFNKYTAAITNDNKNHTCSFLTYVLTEAHIDFLSYKKIISFFMFYQIDSVQLHIPSSITRIVDHAFDSMPNLEKLYLPESLTYIGYSTLANCPNISAVYYKGTKKDFYRLIMNIKYIVKEHIKIEYLFNSNISSIKCSDGEITDLEINN